MFVTLETQSHDREAHVSSVLAKNYNTLLADVVSAAPELQQALPSPIESTTPFASMGVSDAAIIDLKVFLNQIVDLLEAVDPD